MTPADRKERARIAAGERWAKPGARAHQADAARKALYKRMADKVDPDRVMPPDELEYAIGAAMAAYAARLRLARKTA